MASHEGDNLDERCAAWERMGALELIDCKEHHRQFGLMKWHRHNPPTQNTWRQLIRLLLAFNGLPTDNEMIRDYQQRKWGAADGDTCVIELSALAANSLSSDQQDRFLFRQTRIETIRSRMLANGPVFAVLYGLSARESWTRLINGTFDAKGFAQVGRTIVVSVKHPVGGKPAEPDAYWIQLGKELRQRCSPRSVPLDA